MAPNAGTTSLSPGTVASFGNHTITSTAAASTAAACTVAASTDATSNITAIAAADEQTLLVELQRRLTKPGARTPVSLDTVALAVSLARGRQFDPKLSARKVCKDAGKQLSHSRVGAMCALIG